MYKRQTFNLAYNGVVEQGTDSSIDGDCVYAGDDGKRCAAGHVFAAIEPDFDLKAIDQEGGDSARAVLNKMGYTESRSRFGQPEFAKLLQGAQSAHDNAASCEDPAAFLPSFKRQMRELAIKHRLTVPK
ncbi:MAG: hypothetical protein KUG81_07410 [Gammaproteobacteria bacterium]|nr:hypothetical protein [Gammaproteobacteria bacterium]